MDVDFETCKTTKTKSLINVKSHLKHTEWLRDDNTIEMQNHGKKRQNVGDTNYKHAKSKIQVSHEAPKRTTNGDSKDAKGGRPNRK